MNIGNISFIVFHAVYLHSSNFSAVKYLLRSNNYVFCFCFYFLVELKLCFTSKKIMYLSWCFANYSYTATHTCKLKIKIDGRLSAIHHMVCLISENLLSEKLCKKVKYNHRDGYWYLPTISFIPQAMIPGYFKIGNISNPMFYTFCVKSLFLPYLMACPCLFWGSGHHIAHKLNLF